jgi:hypothetical protein
MPALLRGLMLFVLLAGPCAAAAPPVAHVTVTAKRRIDERTIRTVITPFVTLHAARDRISGLLLRAPRTGVCPAALGLPQGFDDFVSQRIAAIAKQAGAAVEPAGKCRPNIEVLFTMEPQAVVDRLVRQSDGAILGVHFVGEKGALGHVSHPIQAWYETGTADDSISRVVRLEPDGDVVTVHGRVRPDQAYGSGPYAGTGSRIPARNRSEITNVLIVVDGAKVRGTEIGPVADYIALLALSEAQSLDACNSLPSILDLFASGCTGRAPPQALTDSDLAFLKALYAADLTSGGEAARDKIAHRMALSLGTAPAATTAR